MNFRKSFELRRIVLVRSTEYRFSDKHDQEQGAILKIAEMGHGKDLNVIYVNLDTASELCDRFQYMARAYEELRPIPEEDRQLFCEEIVGNDTTLKLEFNIVASRPVLEISQKKRRATRAPSGSITVRDVSKFQRYMAVLIEELSSIHFVMDKKTLNGFEKIVRGNRVAVIYCSIRPWPWTTYYSPIEKLLFEPSLVNMLLVDRPDIQRITDYCEEKYSELLTETYVKMDDDNQVSIFKFLAIRWIRQGEKFRINEYPGLLTLKNEEHWYTA